jgi:anaerobic magnesium-protoporphyrin IX monomethyl ester cyclase
MLKILLINVPIREDKPFFVPSMGAAYIAGILDTHNYPVLILDLNIDNNDDFDEIGHKLERYDFDIIGITGLITQYDYIKRLTYLLKSLHPGKKIIIGGFIGSTVPELLLTRTKADVIVIGEGEVTIIELLQAIETGCDLSHVNGIAFNRDGSIVVTGKRDLITDIDSIPFPAWDMFPIQQYMDTFAAHYNQERIMPILTSRGCPFDCTFCYDSFGKKTRYRSPENVVSEMKALKSKYNITRLIIYDETFTVNRKRAISICNLMIKENLNIKWECSGRVNCIDEELLVILKAAGLTTILYGIESGSQKMLDVMRKGVTVEQSRRAIRMTKKAGVNMHTPLMLGFPGETEQTIAESVNFFLRENIVGIAGTIYFPTPHPGSELWEYALSKGLIEDAEDYIMNLGDFTSLQINMTDMPDQKLIQMKQAAEKRIFWRYFLRNSYKLPLQIINQIKVVGFQKTLASIGGLIATLRQFRR